MSDRFVPGRKILAELRAACAGMSSALARILTQTVTELAQLLVVDVLFEPIAARDPRARDFIRSAAASVAGRGY